MKSRPRVEVINFRGSDIYFDVGRDMLLSFGEDKPKTGFESLASADLVTITRTEMQVL